MSIIGSNVLAGASGGAGAADYQIQRSLRFNSGDSAYLSRTPSSSGNTSTFTISTWVKRTALSSGYHRIFGTYTGGSYIGWDFEFNNSDQLDVHYYNGSSYNIRRTTTAVYRDSSAWYHIVLAVDLTISGDNSVRLYVNGTEVTVFDTKTNASAGYTTNINTAVQHRIGYNYSYSDFYLAEFHFIDGQQLAPTDFGEFDDNNAWQPKRVAGTYGTNGFHLDFSDNSSNAALGTDSSGNSNTWTVNNLTAAAPTATYNSTYGSGITTAEAAKVFDGDSSTYGVANSDFVGFSYSGTSVKFKIENSSSAVRYFLVQPWVSGSVSNSGTFGSQSVGTVSGNQWTIPANSTGTAVFTFPSNYNGYGRLFPSNSGADQRIYYMVAGPADQEGIDSLVDTPTNYGDDTGAGNEVRGCYATFNPLSVKLNGGTMENGNLTLKASGAYYIEGKSTIDVFSVDNYSELTVTTASGSDSLAFGIGDIDTWIITGGGSYIIYRENGAIISYPGNTTVATVSSYTSGDVLGMAVDSTNVKFYKNGTLQGTYAHSKSGTFFVCAMNVPNTGSAQLDVNFGQRPFAYAAPSGYKALCTQNLPEPTIPDGSAYFDTKLYTGNGSTQTISGLGFSPDLTWVKGRSATQNHLYDTVRGAGEGKSLQSNNTNKEGDALDNATYGYLSAHTSDGFTVDAGSSPVYLNVNSISYVAWAWDAGANSSKTYAVTVVSDSGNKYRFDGHGTSAVTLDLEEGSTYTFDQSDSSNAGHPIRFSTTSDGTHGSGSEYTTGVVTSGTPGSAGAYTKITIAASAPTLYYYCTQHSGMGGQVNTNSTAGATVLSGSLNSSLYDQSQVWSNSATNPSSQPNVAITNGFDGKTESGNITYAEYTGGAFPAKNVSFAIAVQSTDTIRIKVQSDLGPFLVDTGNGTVSYAAGSGSYWLDISDAFTSNVTNWKIGSEYNWNFSGLEINGKILVDSGVSVTAVPSINSVVRANPSAGFSVVTWAGGGSGYSVGHGLGVAPKLYIIKDRNNAFDWPVFTTVIDGSLDYLYLNLTNAKSNTGGSLPTSTLVYPGQSTSSNYVMYCFAPVEGYSAMGSYTGNGSSNGPFVYTGFRPAFLLRKRTDSAGVGWYLIDTARDTYNVSDAFLDASDADAEIAGTDVDILSNGFKLRNPDAGTNASNGTYIYACFAEDPFKTARAR